MAIYSIAVSNYYQGIKDVVAAESSLEIKYDDGVDDLVLYHNVFDVYIQLVNLDGPQFDIRVSNTWTSGANVNAPYYRIQGSSTSSASTHDQMTVIINNHVFAMGQYKSSTYAGALVLFKEGANIIMVSHAGTQGTPIAASANITTENLISIYYNVPLLFPVLNGNYCYTDLYYSNNPNTTPIKFEKMKLLLRTSNTAVPLEGYSTDLIMNPIRSGDSQTITGISLLMQGAYY